MGISPTATGAAAATASEDGRVGAEVVEVVPELGVLVGSRSALQEAGILDDVVGRQMLPPVVVAVPCQHHTATFKAHENWLFTSHKLFPLDWESSETVRVMSAPVAVVSIVKPGSHPVASLPFADLISSTMAAEHVGQYRELQAAVLRSSLNFECKQEICAL